MKKYAIIVAGGSGSRMQSDTPKQFLNLIGKPVLMHTLSAFASYDAALEVILVLPMEHIPTWKKLVAIHSFNITHIVVSGGTSRFESVRNGLETITESGIVAIHDGARPLVTPAVISDTFEKAEEFGNATAVVALKDSLRQMSDTTNFHVHRESYRIVQTPQTFKTALIKKAFAEVTDHSLYTDDASVAEAIGAQIVLTQGSYENIKITTPEDLIFAEAILKSRA